MIWKANLLDNLNLLDFWKYFSFPFSMTFLSKESLHKDSTKINCPGHSIHMYWTNFRQPTAHLQQNIFGKTPTEVCSPCLYASFDTFLRQNWLIIQQLTVFEGKCRWFRISSECLKTHCGANNWPIWTQQVPKEA